MTRQLTDIDLVHGVMQHWSDADHHPAGSTGLFGGVVGTLARRASSVIIVGATALELIVGVVAETAADATEVTVVVRGLGDAERLVTAFAETERVRVVCGDLDDLVSDGVTADLVIALDGVERIASAESAPASWAAHAEQVTRLIADGGTVVLAVENQLGAHRITAPGSRLVDDGDADWLPMAVDPTRPTSLVGCLDAIGAELSVDSMLRWYGGWHTPRVAVVVGHDDGSTTDGSTSDDTARRLRTLTTAYVLRDALRHGHADPSRLVLPAAAAGRLDDLASGWLLIASRGGDAAPDAVPTPGQVWVETAGGLATVSPDGAAAQVTTGAASTRVEVGPELTPLTVELLDRCARADLPGLRRLLRDHRDWLTGQAEGGTVAAELAAAEYDTVARTEDGGFVTLLPGQGSVAVEDVLWRSIGGLVAALRAGGFRHPWPAFSDDLTIATALGAMLGLDVPDDLTDHLPAREADPATDRQTLLARIQRLEETNRANASRAAWFERRLNERERELRRHHDRQLDQVRDKETESEELRRQMAHLRNSPTFKLGRIAITPLRAARSAARKLGM